MWIRWSEAQHHRLKALFRFFPGLCQKLRCKLSVKICCSPVLLQHSGLDQHTAADASQALWNCSHGSMQFTNDGNGTKSAQVRRSNEHAYLHAHRNLLLPSCKKAGSSCTKSAPCAPPIWHRGTRWCHASMPRPPVWAASGVLDMCHHATILSNGAAKERIQEEYRQCRVILPVKGIAGPGDRLRGGNYVVRLGTSPRRGTSRAVAPASKQRWNANKTCINPDLSSLLFFCHVDDRYQPRMQQVHLLTRKGLNKLWTCVILRLTAPASSAAIM